MSALTSRELEVLRRVAGGATSRAIAESLGISKRTVETHREKLMEKLQIRGVANLTRYAVAAGLLSDERAQSDGVRELASGEVRIKSGAA